MDDKCNCKTSGKIGENGYSANLCPVHHQRKPTKAEQELANYKEGHRKRLDEIMVLGEELRKNKVRYDELVALVEKFTKEEHKTQIVVNDYVSRFKAHIKGK